MTDITSSSATLGSDTAPGSTTIVDSVIEKVAGIAVREVPGVHAIGRGAARAIGALRSAVNQQDHGQGIDVQVSDTEVSVSVSLVAEYPVALHTLASAVRSAVSDAIETLVGRRVSTVDVTISDIEIPSDDDQAGA